MKAGGVRGVYRFRDQSTSDSPQQHQQDHRDQGPAGSRSRSSADDADPTLDGGKNQPALADELGHDGNVQVSYERRSSVKKLLHQAASRTRLPSFSPLLCLTISSPISVYPSPPLTRYSGITTA